MKSEIEVKKNEKEALFNAHKGLILSIAKRFSGRGVSIEELFQIGCVGFLKATAGYEKNYGTKLSTYAVPFIMGEIKKFFRDDGQIKVSRSVKTLYLKICAVKDGYIKQYGTEPDVSYIAQIQKVSPEDVWQALLSMSHVSSIYDEDGRVTDTVLKVSDNSQENICDRISIEEALKKLPPMLLAVIQKRYFLNMTQSQTAKILNTNQVQISRLEKKAIALLKGMLGDE